MAIETRPMRMAVLIDADNISSKVADALFTEISRIGETSVRRIYGDFSGPRLKGWAECLARHAIIPRQQFSNTVGKNAFDIALVIDAMDLLLSGRHDGFCLVSSDGDFTHLAARIREHGLTVYGFGNQNTPQGFQSFCQRFVYIEDLLPAKPRTEESSAAEPSPLRPPSQAVPLIREVLAEVESEDGWAQLAAVGTQLVNLAPDFDARTFGFKKLSDLVRKTGQFEVEQADGRPLRIRAKRATFPESAG